MPGSDIPSVVICTAFTAEEYRRRGLQGLRLRGRPGRPDGRHLRRPANQPLADVVAPRRPGADPWPTSLGSTPPGDGRRLHVWHQAQEELVRQQTASTCKPHVGHRQPPTTRWQCPMPGRRSSRRAVHLFPSAARASSSPRRLIHRLIGAIRRAAARPRLNRGEVAPRGGGVPTRVRTPSNACAPGPTASHASPPSRRRLWRLSRPGRAQFESSYHACLRGERRRRRSRTWLPHDPRPGRLGRARARLRAPGDDRQVVSAGSGSASSASAYAETCSGSRAIVPFKRVTPR